MATPPKKTPKKSAGAARTAAKRPLRVLVASGVNLDLLGQREPSIYGTETLADIERCVRDEVESLEAALGLGAVDLEFFQTNDEASFLEKLGEGWDGAILNPGAWTHTSLALADRLLALELPFVEVHLSNLAAREEFRQRSFAAPHSLGVVYGFGAHSYLIGVYGLLKSLLPKP